MDISIRRGQSHDQDECGRICYAAFNAIANAHNFRPDLPHVGVANAIVGTMLTHPDFFGVVAEQSGKIVGSNFLDERNSISGVGPITIDPEVQNSGIGTRLMHAVMERSTAQGFAGIRLVQAGYHSRSLSLYLKLGFNVREHLSCVQGPALHAPIAGYAVRPATQADGGADLTTCNQLCERVHGHARNGEVRDAIYGGTASIVERGGRVTGYTTGIAFFGHTVCETTDDLKALISAAKSIDGPGFLAPSRNGELLRWCFSKGLRVTQTLTLMSMGLYNEPAGAYLCSVTY
jgi:predicted N-acetyltransferase YhbS